MAPKIYCFQSKHYENTMQFICNTINPVHCKMCHLINLLKSTEPQFISKFISSHQSVLWLLPEVWDLHAFSFFFISAEKNDPAGRSEALHTTRAQRGYRNSCQSHKGVWVITRWPTNNLRALTQFYEWTSRCRLYSNLSGRQNEIIQ